jgi:hypothetical protein
VCAHSYRSWGTTKSTALTCRCACATGDGLFDAVVGPEADGAMYFYLVGLRNVVLSRGRRGQDTSVMPTFPQNIGRANAPVFKLVTDVINVTYDVFLGGIYPGPLTGTASFSSPALAGGKPWLVPASLDMASSERLCCAVDGDGDLDLPPLYYENSFCISPYACSANGGCVTTAIAGFCGCEESFSGALCNECTFLPECSCPPTMMNDPTTALCGCPPVRFLVKQCVYGYRRDQGLRCATGNILQSG